MESLTDPQAEVLLYALRGELVRNQRGQFYYSQHVRGLTTIALKLIERGLLADDDPGPICRWWGPALVPVRTVDVTDKGRTAIETRPGWGHLAADAIAYRAKVHPVLTLPGASA